MGWFGDDAYTEAFRTEANASDAADQELETRLQAEYQNIIRMKYALPQDRWGNLNFHQMGPEALKRTLAEMNIQGSQAIMGNVLGGNVDVYYLCAPVTNGVGTGSSQRGLGHEMTHIMDQLAAIWEAYKRGGDRSAMDAAQAARVYDADNQGERVGMGPKWSGK